MAEYPQGGWSAMGFKKFVRGIRIKLKSRFTKEWTPSSFDEYKSGQLGHRSFESENQHWAAGLKNYIHEIAGALPKEGVILDCACGDGLSLDELRILGFKTLVGVEFDPVKAMVARSRGHNVLEVDMHVLSPLSDSSIAAVVSSHSLEHAYNPALVLDEFHRVLQPGGLCFIVVPFPDVNPYAVRAHVGRTMLGTKDRKSGKVKIAAFVKAHGFEILTISSGAFREPELWIAARKEPV